MVLVLFWCLIIRLVLWFGLVMILKILVVLVVLFRVSRVLFSWLLVL